MLANVALITRVFELMWSFLLQHIKLTVYKHCLLNVIKHQLDVNKQKNNRKLSTKINYITWCITT